jgi:plasmid stability protein
MKSLHIREVPESTIERLKSRAKRHHRSLQGELLAVLDEASRLEIVDAPNEFCLRTVKTQGRQDWTREGIYED